MLYRLRINTSLFFQENAVIIVKTDTAITSAGFLKPLTHVSKSLEELTVEIGKNSKTEPSNELTASIKDSYKMLEDYGFIISGETEEELAGKEKPLYLENNFEKMLNLFKK